MWAGHLQVVTAEQHPAQSKSVAPFWFVSWPIYMLSGAETPNSFKPLAITSWVAATNASRAFITSGAASRI